MEHASRECVVRTEEMPGESFVPPVASVMKPHIARRAPGSCPSISALLLRIYSSTQETIHTLGCVQTQTYTQTPQVLILEMPIYNINGAYYL